MAIEQENVWEQFGKRGYSDVNQLKLTPDKPSLVRLLPKKKDAKETIFQYSSHWVEQNTGVRFPIFHEVSKSCPICKLVQKLWADVNELKDDGYTDDSIEIKKKKDFINSISAKASYDINVLDRKNYEDENENIIIKRWTIGNAIFIPLKELGNDPEWGSPTHDVDGYDIRVTGTKQGMGTKYNVSGSKTSSPLTKEEIDALNKRGYDLATIRSAEFTSEEKIDQILRNAKVKELRLLSDSFKKEEDDDEETVSYSRPKKRYQIEDDEDEGVVTKKRPLLDEDDDEEEETPKNKKKLNESPKSSKKKPVDDDEDDDEEEETPKNKKKLNESSKPSKKKPVDDEDDEEEEAPKSSKKKPTFDDEEEEAPKSSKKKPAVDEDDDDEEETPKSSKKKPAVDEDDEDEEETPKASKKSSKKKPAFNDDDEEESPKKSKKKPAFDEDDDEDDITPTPKKKNVESKKTKPVEKDDEDDDDDEDEKPSKKVVDSNDFDSFECKGLHDPKEDACEKCEYIEECIELQEFAQQAIDMGLEVMNGDVMKSRSEISKMMKASKKNIPF